MWVSNGYLQVPVMRVWPKVALHNRSKGNRTSYYEAEPTRIRALTIAVRKIVQPHAWATHVASARWVSLHAPSLPPCHLLILQSSTPTSCRSFTLSASAPCLLVSTAMVSSAPFDRGGKSRMRKVFFPGAL
jgi:hypothetical protein